MPYLLAHDLGTSGNKATLYTTEGKLVASRVHPYDLLVTHGNWAEQRGDDWWEAVCRTTRELAAMVNPAEIEAVSFSGQMMGCLCLDADGRPLRNAIIWADMRSSQAERMVREQMEESDFYRITGHRISPSYSAFKLRWIRDNEPEIYQKTAVVLNAKDYIVYRLTGRPVTDRSDASATCLYDLNRREWSDDMLNLFGLDRDKMPDILPSTAVAGRVTAQAGEVTGLLAGTPVVCGGGDGPCAAVGTGCVHEGIANSCMGTSSWISMASPTPVTDQAMTTVNFDHVVPGYVLPCGTIQSGGGSLSWAVSRLCAGEKVAAQAEGRDVYDRVEEAVSRSPAGAKGLIFLPHLIGERSPHWDPQARGAFLGLTLEHTLDDMMRAVMEGVALTLDMVLSAFRSHIPVDRLVVIGGGARSAAWLQIFANVYGLPIQRPNVLEEACSMGAAVTAGVGAGVYDSFEVIDRFFEIRDTYTPDATAQAQYQALKPVFQKAYPLLKETFHQLDDFQQQTAGASAR